MAGMSLSLTGSTRGWGPSSGGRSRVGSLVADGFVVEEGLAEGELVATAGLRSLMNGMKVRLLEQ